MVALVYYGIGMSTTQLGGNIFINFVLAAIGEILGYVINLFLANNWGRKPTVVFGYYQYFLQFFVKTKGMLFYENWPCGLEYFWRENEI